MIQGIYASILSDNLTTAMIGGLLTAVIQVCLWFLVELDVLKIAKKILKHQKLQEKLQSLRNNEFNEKHMDQLILTTDIGRGGT